MLVIKSPAGVVSRITNRRNVCWCNGLWHGHQATHVNRTDTPHPYDTIRGNYQNEIVEVNAFSILVGDPCGPARLYVDFCWLNWTNQFLLSADRRPQARGRKLLGKHQQATWSEFFHRLATLGKAVV